MKHPRSFQLQHRGVLHFLLTLTVWFGWCGHSPAAVGGGSGNNTFSTSTSQHTTTTALTVDQRTSSGLIQNILNGGDQLRIGWSLGHSLKDPKVQAALKAALKVLNQQKPPFPHGATLRTLSRSLGTGGSSSTSTQIVGTPMTTTTTFAIGPQTIFIGTDGSQSFFVPAGTINFNTNTHTETLQNQITTLTGGAATVETLLLQRILFIDLGAVYSVLYSGLPVALAQRGSLLNAHAGGIGDVNERIFRAWLGPNETEPQGDAGFGSDVRIFVSGNVGWLSQNGGGGTAGIEDTRAAGSVGAEWRLSEALRLGVAATYVHSDTDYSGDLGSQEIDGGALSVYLTWRSGDGILPSSGKSADGKLRSREAIPSLQGTPSTRWYVDLLYSAGLFDNATHRNTLAGSTAHGSADDWSHLVSLNAGYVFQVSDTFATGPYASLTYVHGELDGYSEHGGGSAALRYEAQSYDSLVSLVGWQGNWKLRRHWGALLPLVHVGWERENLEDGGDVSATLLQSPFSIAGLGRFGGFGVSGKRDSARYDALVVGAALGVDLGDRWSLNLSATERTDFGPRHDFSLGLRAQCRY